MIRLFTKFKTTIFFLLAVIFVFLTAGFGKNNEVQYTKAATTSCKGPADVMLVIDRSGTMSSDLKFTSAKSASVGFVDKLFSAVPNDSFSPFDYHQIGLVAFNQNIDTEKLNQDGAVIKSYITNPDGILGENNGYPIGSRNTAVAIQQARLKMDLVEGGNPYATKTMIILTDGVPNNLDNAKAQADIARNEDNNIRIISVGLKLDKITDETNRNNAKDFIKYIASSLPADCYYVYDSGEELDNCISIDASELGTKLDGVYDSITDAICDESDPTIAISKKPSGTLYSVDNLKITSTATDDVGFKSHLIKWSDNWANSDDIITVICGDLSGTIINCSTESLGPFDVGKTITYRSIAIDANDNSVKIDPPKTVAVASVTLTIPALLRNKGNIITAKILNYGGNDNFSVTIKAKDLEGEYLAGKEIIKAPMTTPDSGTTRTYSYTFNQGCDWTDGITDGSANNINVDIYVYAKSNDVGIRQIASSENRPLASNFEGPDSLYSGTCTDNINNDCDYKDNDPLKPIIDLNPDGLDEALCDITGPIVGISRNPAGDVYDDDSITFTSNATDDNGIKQHIIKYKKEGDTNWTTLDCTDVDPKDGKIICNGVEVTQSIAIISTTVGPFNAGKNVEYYFMAIDYSGNNNTTSTATESFIVKNRACEFVDNLGDCNLPYSGKCCDGVCNATISPTSYNTDYCAKEICNGVSWEWGPANDTDICSESGEPTECHSFSSLYGPPPGDPPYFHDGGCEERAYRCSSGYCDYGSAIIKGDYCIGGGSLVLNDYECSGTSCVLNPDPAITNDICDLELDSLSINAYNNEGDFICGGSEATGEVLDDKTNKIFLISSVSDINGISEHRIYWRKNGGAWSNKNCGTCPNGNTCDCDKDIGPYNVGDVINFYAWAKDNSPNETESQTATYSFTVRDKQCYYINSQDDKGIIANLTPCNSGSGMCCGGTCDGAISATSYDEGCFVDSCSGTNWVSVAGNESVACGVSNTCFDYYSPNNDFYSGCMNGGNKCSSGYCLISSSETFPSACDGNSLTSYDCDDYEDGTCKKRDSGTDIDCSIAGTNYDSDTVACNCDCDNYDTEEKVYSSLSFDGVDDYVTIPNSAIFNTTNLTISAWVNFADNSPSFIFEKGNVNTQYSLFSHGTDIVFRTKPVGGSYNTLSVTKAFAGISNNQWHYIVGTYDGLKKRLYVDGDEKESYDWVKTIETNNNGSSIGRFGGTTTGYYFTGMIDDVRIYNRALYPEEVSDHYNGIFADDTGLVGHWNFDEGTGEIAYDYHDDTLVNNNNGTLKNGPQWVKYGNGDDEDEDGNVIDVLSRNVPAPWQVCTDGKDNDCDLTADDYIKESSGIAELGGANTLTDNDMLWIAGEWQDGIIEIVSGAGNGQIRAVSSNTATAVTVDIDWDAGDIPDNTSEYNLIKMLGDCDGKVDAVSVSATANKACVYDSEDPCDGPTDLTDLLDASANNHIEIFDINIKDAINDLTLTAAAVDDFLIYQTEIKWTADNWGTPYNKVCSNTGVCKVCVEGGSCGEDNDDILSSLLSADSIFKFKVCAVDNSVNNNQKCTDEYSIEIKSSNAVPVITPLSVIKPNFCLEGLRYILNWEFSDDGDAQASYEIQIKEGDSDFETGNLVINKTFNALDSFYQINSDDFEDGESLEYGEKKYYWRVKVTDNRGGGYSKTTEWEMSTVETDAVITTPLYEFPQVDFSAVPDYSNNCLYKIDAVGTDRCDYGENITFSDDSTFIECTATNNKECLTSVAADCDTDNNNTCVPCGGNNECQKFNSGSVGYSCVEGVCEASGSCADNNDCEAADFARCDIDSGLCVACDDDSQCTNDKFDTTGIDYFCNNEGVCEDKEHRKWWFYSDSSLDVDSRDPNPINNYIESVLDNYNVILEIKDIVGNSCSRVKKIILGGKKYPKWNEVSSSN